MKKQLTVALGLAVLATPVFASKARLQALGEDVNGSFYVNDNRNVFLNSAQVNNYKDMVTFEWGNTANVVDSTGTDAATGTGPRAEGGLFRSHNNMVWGLYLGSESNTSNTFRGAAVGAADAGDVDEENNIDLFIAGDAGVKWGANVTYSKSADDETNGDANQSAVRTRFGVIAGDIEGWANINVSNKAEDSTGDEFKGKLGFKVGGIYHMNDYNIFADYQKFDGEATQGGADFDLKSSQIQVGVGRASKLNDKATLFTKVQLTMANVENEGSVGAAGQFGGANGCATSNALGCEEYKSTLIPVIFGLEYDAASWLVLRGSVAQNILGNEEDAKNKRSIQDSTVVNAGATLKFGELSFDGVIGNGVESGTATPNSNNAAGNNTSTGAGTLRTDNLMSRVSMTYRF